MPVGGSIKLWSLCDALNAKVPSLVGLKASPREERKTRQTLETISPGLDSNPAFLPRRDETDFLSYELFWAGTESSTRDNLACYESALNLSPAPPGPPGPPALEAALNFLSRIRTHLMPPATVIIH